MAAVPIDVVSTDGDGAAGALAADAPAAGPDEGVLVMVSILSAINDDVDAEPFTPCDGSPGTIGESLNM